MTVTLDDIYRQIVGITTSQSEFRGKLDTMVALWQQEAKGLARDIVRVRDECISSHGNAETQIRALETKVVELSQRHVVTPRAMWAAIATITPIAGLLMTLIIEIARN